MHTLYADEVTEHKETMREIRARLAQYDPPITEKEWDTKQLGPLPSAAEGSGAEAENDSTEGMDPSMAAFMALQKQLQTKK